MAELKTKITGQSVDVYLNNLQDEKKRQDCFTILEVLRQATGAEPRMWGESIIGLGEYHYKYASGREGDWFLVGLSPRKQNLTLYIVSGFPKFTDLLQKLGKYKTGKGCLYINKVEDIDLSVLKQLVEQALAEVTGG
jgi:hypothetical protein